jgi:hypothetical protein
MALLMTGCSTITKSTFLGIGTGATVGAASGALIAKHNSAQAVLTSAIFIGVVGGIAGYFGHQELEKRDYDVRHDALFNLEKYGVSGLSDGIKQKNNDDSINVKIRGNNEH